MSLCTTGLTWLLVRNLEINESHSTVEILGKMLDTPKETRKQFGCLLILWVRLNFYVVWSLNLEISFMAKFLVGLFMYETTDLMGSLTLWFLISPQRFGKDGILLINLNLSCFFKKHYYTKRFWFGVENRGSGVCLISVRSNSVKVYILSW